MENILESQECKVQLLEFLVKPVIAKKTRCRAKPSRIRILYHLFQLEKNKKNRGWKDTEQGRKRISKEAKASLRHFKEFITDPDFLLYGTVIRRGGTTNIYRLHPWVNEFFRFFEIKGMMQGFRKDQNSWAKTFLKRLRKWVIPLLRNGHSLNDILMNNLSMKNPLKGPDPNSLKGARIKPFGVPPIKHSEFRSNSEPPPLPAIKDLERIGGELRTRFNLRDGDVNWLINSFKLNDLRGAYRIRSEYGTSYEPRSPIKMFMHCMKKHRAQKGNGAR